MPSVAAAVVRGGEVVWADAVGARRRGAGRGRRRRTTSTASARSRRRSPPSASCSCATQGKLELEDRLDAHLDVPARGDLTLRRMLSHGSGLQREIPGDVWETLEFPKSTEELLASLEEAEAVLAPGERWHYSNLAFILLGEIVAQLSGMPYEDYVEQRILQPLGLTRTSFAPEAPTAIAYSVEPYSDVVRREPMLVERTGGIAAAGQLWSTVGDLCRWASFLADPDPDVLAPESLELMTSVQTMADPYRWSLAWGVGLMLARKDDRIYCGHDGGMPGYLANVLVDRDERLGAAVLVNGDSVDPGGAVARAHRQDARALPARARRRGCRSAAPPEELASALGRWWSEGTEFVFRWHDGRLEARWAEAPEWQPWTRFERLDGDRFRTAFGRERGELLRLVRDAGGERRRACTGRPTRSAASPK